MANPFYTVTGIPVFLSRGTSSTVRNEYALISTGFDGVNTALALKGAIAGQTWTGTHVFPSTVSIGNVSATEISYLDGATSNIQTQIDTLTSGTAASLALKGNINNQTWTGTHVFPATVSIGNVSDIEIAYLDGTTSNIQTQLNSKAGLASPAFTGTPTVPTATPGTNTDQAASTAFVIAQGLISALPGQSLGFLRSDGVTPSFTQTHTGYAQKEVKGANIASAATVNLSTATGNLVHITGTTGITAFTVDSGAEYTVVFDGIVTVTHNATTLILPTGGNLTTTANEVWKIRGDGSGNARVVSIQRADGRQIAETKSANIASAATVNLTASTGNLIHITGTTGITAFTTANGAEYTVVFDGIVTVTHNATTLILPTGANITTDANDVWVIRGDGAGNARVTDIQRASGQALATVTQNTVSASQLDKTSNTTLSNIPNLTATLIAGGTYRFKLVAFTTLSPAGSCKFGLNGGTATATSFVAATHLRVDTGTIASLIITSISSTLNNASINATMVVIEGTIVCNAGGTFIPQFAQNTSDAGTCSVLVNSTFTVDRIN